MQQKKTPIQKAVEKINNVEPNKAVEIENFVNANYPLVVNVVKLVNIIRKFLGISKPINKGCDEYWTLRGWDVVMARHNSQTFMKSHKKRLSPFNYKFWMEQGLSEADAKFKANSIRPIRKEYWTVRGYSEEEAAVLAADQKHKNNKKGAQTPKDEAITRYNSPRCVEYWKIRHNMSDEEAEKMVSKVQVTFSLEKCVQKYGEVDGLAVWEARQKKWINTLFEKSEEEKTRINLLKGRVIVHEDCDENRLYLIVITDNTTNEKFLKIGVTNKSVVKRFSCLLNKGYDIETIFFEKFSNCYQIEQEILEKYADIVYIPTNKFQGWTECFPLDMKNRIIESVEIIKNDSN